tara:strand:+ start:3683 stop:4264 length:582 start_codon:yes stop_codon:yes gene_type:complete
LKYKKNKNFLGLVATFLILSCSSQITVLDPNIPKPVIASSNLSAAIKYPDNFEDFSHEEQIIGEDKWQIKLGGSNKILFNKLFSSIFNDFIILDKDSALESTIDILIEPEIEAFEFSVPKQSQTNAFAVWIRYRIKIYDNQGKTIANWPISAYGKSETGTFSDNNDLGHAAILAMRDAAALIILQIEKSSILK